MNLVVLVFGLTTIGYVFCKLPTDADYNTANLQKIKQCEIRHKLSDAEKSIWWSWEIPKNPTRCFMGCVFDSLGWTDKDGISHYGMKVSYAAVGHGMIAPTRRYIKRRCVRYPVGANRCESAVEMYKCLLEYSPRINPVYTRFFKDAFHGKVGAWKNS